MASTAVSRTKIPTKAHNYRASEPSGAGRIRGRPGWVMAHANTAFR